MEDQTYTQLSDNTTLTIEGCIRLISDEYLRCYWNTNQKEGESFIYNTGEEIITPVFEARAYVWDEDSYRATLPNFQYKGLRYDWYKHLGRGDYATALNPDEITTEFLGQMVEDCCQAIRFHFNDLYPRDKENPPAWAQTKSQQE